MYVNYASLDFLPYFNEALFSSLLYLHTFAILWSFITFKRRNSIECYEIQLT
uniref:Uncharacterized protein n=1 Tax=Octopus bimaculoides TaxID=37653 RepID=A0A0L8IHT4_OCTBM